MNRKVLRSSIIAESVDENLERRDLDRTIVVIQDGRESKRHSDLGGHTANPRETMEGLPDAITKKLEELERKVKNMVNEEKKRKEKMEAERDRVLQKKLTTIETSINRSMEITAQVTETLEERSTRIETQFSRLETQQSRILERVNAKKERREESR